MFKRGLMLLPYIDTIMACSNTNKNCREMCNSESFWRQKAYEKYNFNIDLISDDMIEIFIDRIDAVRDVNENENETWFISTFGNEKNTSKILSSLPKNIVKYILLEYVSHMTEMEYDNYAEIFTQDLSIFFIRHRYNISSYDIMKLLAYDTIDVLINLFIVLYLDDPLQNVINEFYDHHRSILDYVLENFIFKYAGYTWYKRKKILNTVYVQHLQLFAYRSKPRDIMWQISIEMNNLYKAKEYDKLLQIFNINMIDEVAKLPATNINNIVNKFAHIMFMNHGINYVQEYFNKTLPLHKIHIHRHIRIDVNVEDD